MPSLDNPKYITPPNFLKQKVGSGGLSDEIIQKAQKTIEQSNDEFKPYAKNFIEFIETMINQAYESNFRTHDQLSNMIYPIMQLKAHGGMFGQPLMSEISASALTFLETIYVLDDDALDVLKVHYNALYPVSENKIHGLGGAAGERLIAELYKACDRYYKKHGIEPDS